MEVAMTIRKLKKSQWRPFFDGISKILEGMRVEIEVASLRLGDQIDAEWLPFLGITYDPKDDIVEVALENVDHMIRKPRDIYVDETAGDFISIAITDAEGTEQIVKVREPVALPPPPMETGEHKTPRR
jgi:hypothetical protein